MKKYRFIKTSISGFLLISFFVIVGCNEKSDLVNNPAQSKSATTDFYVIEFDDVINSIEDATLEKDMDLPAILNKQDSNNENFRLNEKPELTRKPNSKRMFLGLIFRKLDLTDDQKELIKISFEEHRECLSDPLAQLREAITSIVSEKREQIIAIRDKVKAEELTREEARKLIREINIATREAIATCEACIEAKETMVVCKESLLENIASALDKDQLVIWNEWLSKLQKP